MVDRYIALSPFWPLDKMIAKYDYFISGKESFIIDEMNIMVMECIDDKIITGDINGNMKFWEGNKCVLSVKAHKDYIIDFLILPDNRIITISGDESFKIWNIKGELLHEEYASMIDFVKFLNRDSLLVGRYARSLKIFDLNDYIYKVKLKTEHKRLKSVTTYDTKIINVSINNDLNVWNYQGQLLHKTQLEPVKALAKISNTEMAIIFKDKTIQIWNIDSFQYIRTIPQMGRRIFPLDNKLFIIGKNTITNNYDQTLSVVKKIHDVIILPDNRIMISNKNSISIFDNERFLLTLELRSKENIKCVGFYKNEILIGTNMKVTIFV